MAKKYDAFLSHNSQDKPSVTEIGRRLEEIKSVANQWGQVNYLLNVE